MVKDYATEYAKAVVSGKKEMACKAEIQACQRHLNDLKRDDLVWRPDIAEKHIMFAETLKVYVKNERKYVPLKLRGFQKFIICSLFGWYTKTSVRRFTESLVMLSRKNGKSFLNGFLCLDFSTLSAIKNGQIVTAGTKFDNAKFVFDSAKDLIEADPKLAEYFVIKDYGDSRSRIYNKRNGTKIQPLSGDSSQDGRQVLLACVDELHLAEDDEMVNVLRDSQVGLNGSLLSIISTAGKNLNGPMYRFYTYCKQVLAGTLTQDNLFAYIVEVDLPDAHKDEKAYNDALWNKQNWAQANPFLLYDDDYHVTTDVDKWKDFEDNARMAKEQEGSLLNNFIIKKLDVFSTVGSDAYVGLDDWSACGTDILPNIIGKKCFLGLDLSSKNDLSSVSAIFPAQEGINIPYLYNHSFLPKGRLTKRIQQDKAPYDRWALKGNLSLTDSNGVNPYILDYRFIAQFIKDFIKENQLQVIAIGYDAHGIGGIMQDLDDIEGDKIEIGQYPKSMDTATRHFRSTVEGRQLQYDKNNELLSWSIINAVCLENSQHELIIDKKLQRNRIDPIDAVLDAWKCMLVVDSEMSQAEKDMQTVDDWLDLMKKL